VVAPPEGDGQSVSPSASLQTALEVIEPGDALEQEAEKVAEQPPFTVLGREHFR
jgi:hypothetical protein